MARIKITLIALLVLALAGGCYRPPKKERDDAREAKRLAQMAEAPKYATDKYNSAEDAMGRAQDAWNDGGKRYKDSKQEYLVARQLYDEARSEAEAADKGEPEMMEREPEFEAAGRDDPSEIFVDVYFDFDDYSLSTGTKSVLDKAAQYLLDNDDINITVEGHCDERGTEEYNIALGERRAKSVRDYLSAYGVPNSRIKIVSKGEFEPDDPGHNEDAWSKNRRGHFIY